MSKTPEEYEAVIASLKHQVDSALDHNARLIDENISLSAQLLRVEQIECDDRAFNDIEQKIREMHAIITDQP